MANAKVKTEHAGAKNGGGAWTTRAFAKQASKKRRRNWLQRELQDAEREVKTWPSWMR